MTINAVIKETSFKNIIQSCFSSVEFHVNVDNIIMIGLALVRTLHECS